MFNFTSLHVKSFLRALLAFSIAIGAPAALAGPMYRVSVDTSAWAGSTGFLSLGFNGGGDTQDAMARATGFSGDFLEEARREGDVRGDVGSSVILGNTTGYNFFDQAVAFGGLFSFDVGFDIGDGVFGTLFSVALFNQAFDTYLGFDGDLLTIDLIPGEPTTVTVFNPDLVEVAQVPEPGDWLLLATGLLLLAASRRLPQRR